MYRTPEERYFDAQAHLVGGSDVQMPEPSENVLSPFHPSNNPNYRVELGALESLKNVATGPAALALQGIRNVPQAIAGLGQMRPWDLFGAPGAGSPAFTDNLMREYIAERGGQWIPPASPGVVERALTSPEGKPYSVAELVSGAPVAKASGMPELADTLATGARYTTEQVQALSDVMDPASVFHDVKGPYKFFRDAGGALGQILGPTAALRLARVPTTAARGAYSGVMAAESFEGYLKDARDFYARKYPNDPQLAETKAQREGATKMASDMVTELFEASWLIPDQRTASMFKDFMTSTAMRRALTVGAVEGGQEGVQNMVSDLWESFQRDEPMKWRDTLAESLYEAAVGAAAGGALGPFTPHVRSDEQVLRERMLAADKLLSDDPEDSPNFFGAYIAEAQRAGETRPEWTDTGLFVRPEDRTPSGLPKRVKQPVTPATDAANQVLAFIESKDGAVTTTDVMQHMGLPDTVEGRKMAQDMVWAAHMEKKRRAGEKLFTMPQGEAAAAIPQVERDAEGMPSNRRDWLRVLAEAKATARELAAQVKERGVEAVIADLDAEETPEPPSRPIPAAATTEAQDQGGLSEAGMGETTAPPEIAIPTAPEQATAAEPAPVAEIVDRDLYTKQGGWKLHLALKDSSEENSAQVKQWIESLGLPTGAWKHMRGGEQGESDFTIYVGSKDKATALADKIETSPIAPLLRSDAYNNADTKIGRFVMGRFDTKGTKAEKGDFSLYGSEGIPLPGTPETQSEAFGSAFDQAELLPMNKESRARRIQQTRRVLANKYGDYFTGSQPAPVAETPAPEAQPQPDATGDLFSESVEESEPVQEGMGGAPGQSVRDFEAAVADAGMLEEYSNLSRLFRRVAFLTSNRARKGKVGMRDHIHDIMMTERLAEAVAKALNMTLEQWGQYTGIERNTRLNDPRYSGRVDLRKARKIIELFKNHDRRTVPHEIMHIALDALPESDKAILREHLGPSMENWVRGLEEAINNPDSYVSQQPEIRGIADWLRSVYADFIRTIKQIWRKSRYAGLSPAARRSVDEVYARMLGSGAESNNRLRALTRLQDAIRSLDSRDRTTPDTDIEKLRSAIKNLRNAPLIGRNGIRVTQLVSQIERLREAFGLTIVEQRERDRRNGQTPYYDYVDTPLGAAIKKIRTADTKAKAWDADPDTLNAMADAIEMIASGAKQVRTGGVEQLEQGRADIRSNNTERVVQGHSKLNDSERGFRNRAMQFLVKSMTINNLVNLIFGENTKTGQLFATLKRRMQASGNALRKAITESMNGVIDDTTESVLSRFASRIVRYKVADMDILKEVTPWQDVTFTFMELVDLVGHFTCNATRQSIFHDKGGKFSLFESVAKRDVDDLKDYVATIDQWVQSNDPVAVRARAKADEIRAKLFAKDAEMYRNYADAYFKRTGQEMEWTPDYWPTQRNYMRMDSKGNYVDEGGPPSIEDVRVPKLFFPSVRPKTGGPQSIYIEDFGRKFERIKEEAVVYSTQLSEAEEMLWYLNDPKTASEIDTRVPQGQMARKQLIMMIHRLVGIRDRGHADGPLERTARRLINNLTGSFLFGKIHVLLGQKVGIINMAARATNPALLFKLAATPAFQKPIQRIKDEIATYSAILHARTGQTGMGLYVSDITAETQASELRGAEDPTDIRTGWVPFEKGERWNAFRANAKNMMMKSLGLSVKMDAKNIYDLWESERTAILEEAAARGETLTADQLGEATALRVERIVEDTQASANMYDATGWAFEAEGRLWTRMFTVLMSDPMKRFSMAVDSYFKYRNGTGTLMQFYKDIYLSWIGSSLSWTLIRATVGMLIKGGVTAVAGPKPGDDEDDEEKWAKFIIANTNTAFREFLDVVPFFGRFAGVAYGTALRKTAGMPIQGARADILTNEINLMMTGIGEVVAGLMAAASEEQRGVLLESGPYKGTPRYQRDLELGAFKALTTGANLGGIPFSNPARFAKDIYDRVTYEVKHKNSVEDQVRRIPRSIVKREVPK